MTGEALYTLSPDGNWKKFDAEVTEVIKGPQNPIRPDELHFQFSESPSVRMLSEVVYVVTNNIHYFHGFVSDISDNNGLYTVVVKSAQWLLDFAYIPDYTYHGMTIDQILSSDAPTSTLVGALEWVNSLIPNGLFQSFYNGKMVYLGGIGASLYPLNPAMYATTSFPNAGTCDPCDGVQALTRQADWHNIVNNQYYLDSANLVLQLGDGSYRENAFLVLAHRWKDIKIRKGTISIGSKVPTIDQSLVGQASKSFDSFFEKCGLELQFLPMPDFLVYMNAAPTIARGSELNPVASYTHKSDCWIRQISQRNPNYQAAIGADSADQCYAPEVLYDPALALNKPVIFDIVDTNGQDREVVHNNLVRAINNNDRCFEVRTNIIDYALRQGDWIRLIRDEIGLNAVLRIQQIEINAGMFILTCGKQVITLAQMFGDFLRQHVQPNQQPAKSQALTNGAGSFTALNQAGLRIYYEESFSIPSDGSTVSLVGFADLSINSKIVPPGRIKLENGSSLKMDITDYCTLGAANSVARNLYNATGWTSQGAKINQYIALSVL